MHTVFTVIRAAEIAEANTRSEAEHTHPWGFLVNLLGGDRAEVEVYDDEGYFMGWL